jgi:hypothetical protein
MKNQIFLCFLSFFFFLFNPSHAIYSQDVHPQEITHETEHEKPILKFNFLLTPFAEFKENAKVDYIMGPEFMVEGSKSHHHLGYEMRSNSLNTLHGYIFNQEYGIYGFFQKKLITHHEAGVEEFPDKILSLGFERFFVAKELDRIIYFEVGTDFHKPIFSFGMVMELHILRL